MKTKMLFVIFILFFTNHSYAKVTEDSLQAIYCSSLTAVMSVNYKNVWSENTKRTLDIVQIQFLQLATILGMTDDEISFVGEKSVSHIQTKLEDEKNKDEYVKKADKCISIAIDLGLYKP